MNIERIEVFAANLPLKRPFRIAIGETIVAETLYIRVWADNGQYGMGEANLFTPIVGETQATALAAARDLARYAVGRDPLDIDDLVAEMRRFMPSNPTTRSGFDMALYDLVGKAAGLPLHALLGGPRRTFTTDNTVGIDATEAMVEHAVGIVSRGFPAVKIKVGTAVEDDVEHVARIREAVGPEILLRIDANQGWDRPSAIRALRAMEPFGVQYCEQPVAHWDLQSMRDVREKTSIPIMADESLFDEHDALKLATMRACDFFNIKLAKSGGIHVALKINAIAEAAGLRCMVGCMTESRLGLTAGAHVVSARHNIAFADLDGADMLLDDPVVGGMVYGDRGEITLPEGPGLGADIAADYLASLESYEVP